VLRHYGAATTHSICKAFKVSTCTKAHYNQHAIACIPHITIQDACEPLVLSVLSGSISSIVDNHQRHFMCFEDGYIKCQYCDRSLLCKIKYSAMQKPFTIAPCQHCSVYMTICNKLANISRRVTDVMKLTQSPSLGACPMPISSNVFGPLPGVDAGDGAGLGGVGVTGLFACTGAGLGGGCCCCNVCTLLGFGMLSYPLGRPAEPGRDEGRGP
jgi:hypothetical protein